MITVMILSLELRKHLVMIWQDYASNPIRSLYIYIFVTFHQVLAISSASLFTSPVMLETLVIRKEKIRKTCTAMDGPSTQVYSPSLWRRSLVCWPSTSSLKRTKRLISNTLSLLKLPLPLHPLPTQAFQVTITDNNIPNPVISPVSQLKTLPLS